MSSPPTAMSARPVDFSDPTVQRVIEIVSKETQIPRERLVADARIEDLGIASLDIVQSIFEIERVFDIEVPVVTDTTGGEFGTVGDLVGHVLRTIDKAKTQG